MVGRQPELSCGNLDGGLRVRDFEKMRTAQDRFQRIISHGAIRGHAAQRQDRAISNGYRLIGEISLDVFNLLRALSWEGTPNHWL